MTVAPLPSFTHVAILPFAWAGESNGGTCKSMDSMDRWWSIYQNFVLGLKQWRPQIGLITHAFLGFGSDNAASQIAGCVTSFVKLTLRERSVGIVGIVPVFVLHSNLPAWASWLSNQIGLEFPKVMALGNINLPSQRAGLEVALEFMAGMGLSQVTQSLTDSSGHTSNLFLLLQQWQSVLK